MIFSMTGFGKSAVETQNKKITVEIKSLNSKQLDLSVKIPPVYRENESEIRNIVSHHVLRGKVEVYVYIDNDTVANAAQFNLAALAAYKRQIIKISNELSIPLPADWFSLFMRLPDALRQDSVAETDNQEITALLDAVRGAIDALVTFRKVEGAKLYDFFIKKIETIRKLLAQVDAYEEERVVKIKAKIKDNLAKLSGVDIDAGRLEQEMIYYIEKLDVTEEKQRLAQHLDYFIETLDAEHGQGKKLGFIAQEMGREINTLGSKSNHAEMQKIVVKMKDELEQIKEQVLNVL